MFSKKLLSVVIVTLFLSQGVYAADNKLSDYQSGFYVGVLGGYQRISIDWGGDVTYQPAGGVAYRFGDYVTRSDDKGKIAGKLFLGYSFCPYFSIDTGYTYYPNNKLSATVAIPGEAPDSFSFKYAIHTIDLMPKFTLPLEKISYALAGWNLYGKFGPVLAVTVLSNNSNGELTGGTYGVKPAYALGIGYNFTDHFGVDFSWSGIFSRDKLLDSIITAHRGSKTAVKYVPSVMLFGVSLTYKF